MDTTGNAFHIVNVDGTVTASAVLDGFTITGANTTGAADENGAGMRIADGSPTLTNLIVQDNTSALYGAGIYIFTTNTSAPEANYSRPSITHVTFSNNTAVEGGGLYAENASPILNKVVFNDNAATGNAFGGAGGGMHTGTFNTSDATSLPMLTNVTFTGNSAIGGGGMYTANSNVALNNVTFDNNSASRRGGGLFNENSNPTLTNVTFYNNISYDGMVDPKGGGGMMNVNSDPVLINVTFSGNNSIVVGGDAINNAIDSKPQINNSIFWGDTDDEIINDGSSSVAISYSVLQGGCPATVDFTCANIVLTDPNLGDLADNGGFTQTMAIESGSSALDTGNTATCATTDQRGVTRPQGSACDMGAYEFDNTPPAIATATSTTANGTYNSGDIVNITVDFSENISSTGLTINLDSGGSINTGAFSNITSFSGNYIVGAGQNSADLTISSVTGTITDIATNTTTNPSVPPAQNIADSKAIVIDTTAPTVTINDPNTTPAQSKTITASTSDGTLTMSNTSDSVCDNTLTFIAYSSQTFSSSQTTARKSATKQWMLLAILLIAYPTRLLVLIRQHQPSRLAIQAPLPRRARPSRPALRMAPLTMSNTSGSTCDGTLIFVAYSSQTFSSEADNGKEVCYKAEDTAGNIAYSVSNAIAGIDATAPTITISNPDTAPALSKTITASPSDGILTMSITNGLVCDNTLTFIAYSSQTFSSEADNGKKVCYRAVDAVSNTAYSMSNAIAGIDRTPPTITISNPTTTPAQSKDITASASDGTLTMRNTNGSICDGTLTFIAYSSQTFTSEADNGKKVCYKAVDAVGNIAYSLSNAIAGIDTTAPVVGTFTATSPSNSLDIAISAFSASDTGGSGVAGYMITTSAGAPLASISGWSGTAPSIYHVSADGTYTLYPWAKDAAGNVSAVFGTGVAVAVDAIAPTVSSVLRANADFTAAFSVNFTVTFSEVVTGVDVTDFDLVPSVGISGASIASVSGSNASYTVIVDTGTGNGTLGLNVKSDGSIKDTFNHPLAAPFTTGEIYHVEKVADVDINIGNQPKGSYSIPSNETLIKNYPSVLSGPVKVISTSENNIVASQRVVYGNSFNELMGYPSDQFATEYWFPWYDNVYMKTWVLVGNPSATDTAYVDIYIGGVKVNNTIGGIPYKILPGANIQPRFPGQPSGPVRVVSVTGDGTPSPLNIFASERSTFHASFNEVMGVPFDQFTTEYWFPWYDNTYMKTWVLVGNPSATDTAYVDIYIGGVKVNDTEGGVPYAIPANSNIQPRFPGQPSGPVRVVSVTGDGTPTPLNIFSSERSTYGASFSEVMGMPFDQFTTDYWYTWVDKFNTNNMKTWILVGNPSSSQTAYVDIYIAGIKQGATRTIAPNSNITPKFDISNGPVEVVSVTGDGTPTPIDIFTSERVIYGSSFNEMMGYPANQLTTEYWFTWYDYVYMKTDVLVGKP